MKESCLAANLRETVTQRFPVQAQALWAENAGAAASATARFLPEDRRSGGGAAVRKNARRGLTTELCARIMYNAYCMICIECFIFAGRGADNGSEEQIHENGNGGGGAAGSAGQGAGGLTAKNIGDELGTSTQPIFTAFGSMDGIKTAVYAAAVDVYDRYTHAGLQEDIPFLGVGKQYIRFAREEPELYRLLFLTREKEYSAAASMRHLQEHVRPALMDIYHITGEEADVYFRDLWLVVHSLSTLIVTDDCPYSDQEVGQILTGFSISICKAIKEVPGFAAGTFDRDAAFRTLVGGDA